MSGDQSSLFGEPPKRPAATFDAKQAREEREKAINQVEANRADWNQLFRQAVLATARQTHSFTTDDVLKRFPELEKCEEKRVLGAVIRKLYKDEYLERGPYRESNRVTSHARPKRTWMLKKR